MLMIAIPKSASTTIMKTIGVIHKFKYTQEKFSDLSRPKDFKSIYGYHSDIRELTPMLVRKFNEKNLVYKQHVLPTENNIKLLAEVKKVILLRDPNDIIRSYKRSVMKHLGEPMEDFVECTSETSWLEKAG